MTKMWKKTNFRYSRKKFYLNISKRVVLKNLDK